MDYLYYLFIVLAFIAVVLLLEGVYLTWNAYKGPEAVRIERRLQSISAGWHGADASLIKQRLLSNSPALERLLMQIPRIHSLDRLLVQSGLQLSVMGFIGYTCMTILGSLALLSLLNLPFFILILCVVCVGAFPTLYVLRARNKRTVKIEEQLPEAIDLISRALKAGHAFSSTLQMVATESNEPISEEFRTTFDEINFGLSMHDALMNLSTRIPSTDLRYFVIAVLIQGETGGNLTELLENISALIRARMKLMGTIRVLSAEGKLSAWILSLMPFVMAFLLNLINPGFLDILFTDPIGPILIGGFLTVMIVGIFIMSRIIKIRV